MLVFTLGLSMALTRLFVAAGGSVLVVALAHASLNAFGDRLSDSAHLSGDPFLVSVAGLLGFALMAIVLAVVYGYRRRSHGDGSRLGPVGPPLRGTSAAIAT